MNLDPDAGPLSDHLAALPARTVPYRHDRQYKWWSKSTVVRANWIRTRSTPSRGLPRPTIHPESVSFVNYVGTGSS